jgi:metal-sulfur cluster biosynthetic enzyme
MTRQHSLQDDVLAALRTVIDPELDRSVLELGFAGADVRPEGDVTIELRLPTYWCAPNFAFMMAHDALEAVRAVPGVRTVRVDLLEHFAAREVNDGLSGDRSFDESFTELTDGSGLETLRRLFWAKSFMVHQERVARKLLAAGRPPAELVLTRLRDVDGDDPDLPEYLAKRVRLGLSIDPDEPFVVYPNGHAVALDRLVPYLDRSRLVGVSLDANVELCRSLHATRYSEEMTEVGS